jgi:dipeptidyl aminopeptidase/acylaminoacyl peptidase
MKKFYFLFLAIIIIAVLFLVYKSTTAKIPKNPTPANNNVTPVAANPLAISAMRKRSYPGSEIVIEKTLEDGSNYHQYLTSYQSDGLKIYALLTVPFGTRPTNGWPVILFNHGYIPPEQYQTFPSVGQYATYYPVFSRSGYIVFKPDYRGNDNSEGTPEGAYYSPAYTVDDLNALASIKKYAGADPNRVGIWGHSMGGNITLRDLVVRPGDVKAAVIWGGVVGSYEDLMFNWQRKVTYRPSPKELALRNNQRSNLIKQYGDPGQNPAFWNTLDPTNFASDIKVPVQLDVGGADEEVPVSFSQSLRDKLLAAGKTVEYFEYPGANHNISQGFDLAMQRSLAFFDLYLK